MKKTKYNPNDWVRGASQISNFLGITRMTLYRWSKVVPLARVGGTNNWNKDLFGSHNKSSLVKWAREAYGKQCKKKYTILRGIRKAEESLTRASGT
jgi:hypothetical protein